MTEARKHTLPTHEMRDDMPPAFINGDAQACDLPLNSKDISEMAFRSVFKYQYGKLDSSARSGK
jgi:hypothetical protein